MATSKAKAKKPARRAARKPAEAANALKDPGKIDYDKADQAFKRLVRENESWLKEMANR